MRAQLQCLRRTRPAFRHPAADDICLKLPEFSQRLFEPAGFSGGQLRFIAAQQPPIWIVTRSRELADLVAQATHSQSYPVLRARMGRRYKAFTWMEHRGKYKKRR
ncbi:hypothetical protein GCM10010136_22300 [Limoniibacter endophyticus]|uniref:Uncharacterized protein n=1 Tax=Limoniibacter endophyticus TaxID=1565040 RepID=A0A8J3DPE2_9HYPH|nr:hypothetical protein GCM10010136_22300 [Limoniibacter endophyticus]